MRATHLVAAFALLIPACGGDSGTRATLADFHSDLCDYVSGRGWPHPGSVLVAVLLGRGHGGK